jgi:hypothetical protein
MLPQQNLDKAVTDEFVRRPKFLVCPEHSIGIACVCHLSSGLQRLRRFVGDGISKYFTCDIP